MAFKFSSGVDKFRGALIRRMVENSYPQEYAERTFRQIEGFGGYGFPESHAASIAMIAYASSSARPAMDHRWSWPAIA